MWDRCLEPANRFTLSSLYITLEVERVCMGIHLNWEVESNVGKRSIREDPAVIAARKKRARRIRRTLASVGLILSVLLSAMMFRLNQVEAKRRQYLEATVAAEALALRLGDERAFMRAQVQNDLWRQAQHRSFSTYQALSRTLEIGESPSAVDISGDQARVRLPIKMNGSQTEAIWVYDYTEDGWLHVSTDQEPWGERTLQVEPFSILYPPTAEDQVNALAPMLTQWWSAVCEVIDLCGDPPDRTILMTNDPGEMIRWADGDQHTLVIPAGTDFASPAVRDVLLEALVHRWALDGLHRKVPPYEAWVADETAAILRDRIDKDTESGRVIGPLFATFDDSLWPTFLRTYHEGELASVALHEAMKSAAPCCLSSGYFEEYLTQYLRSEAWLRAWEGDHSARRADWHWQTSLAFLDQERRFNVYPNDNIIVQPFVLSRVDPDTITVADVKYYQDIAWVKIVARLQAQQRGGPRPNLSSSRLSGYVHVWIPFRYATSLWVHTLTTRESWGSEATIQGNLVTLNYYGLDEEYAEDFLHTLDQISERIIQNFGVPSPAPIATVNLIPTTDLQAFPGIDPEHLMIVIPSPYVACCLGMETAQSYLIERSTMDLEREILAYRLGQPGGVDQQHPLIEGVLRVQAKHILGSAPPLEVTQDEFVPVTSPNDLWSATLWDYAGVAQPQANANILAGEALITEVVDQYGTDALQSLIDHLLTSTSTDDWLEQSIGAQTADLFDAWQTRYTELLAQAQR